jgi:hypothetical protein
MMSKKILILREDDSVFPQGIFEMHRVGSPNQFCIGRRCDIEISQTQSMSDRMVYVLVKMELYHGLNPWRLISLQADRDHCRL